MSKRILIVDDNKEIVCEVKSYGAHFCSKTDPDVLMKIGVMADKRGDAI